MSMLNQMYLLERYGLRLNVEQLAEVMDSTPAAIHRRISDGTLEIQTYIDYNGTLQAVNCDLVSVWYQVATSPRP